MKALKIIGGIVIVLAVMFVFAAPIGPVPGFFIGGNETEAPATWPDTSQVHEIKLSVPGVLPRVVIIWVIDYEGELYVVGSRGSGWVDGIGQSSPVKLRIGDNTYAVNANDVTENGDAVRDAWLDKYRPDYPDIVAGFPSAEEAEGIVAIFHLART